MLTKDRRHPFVTVTKGEYLQAMEAAVARKYADETQKIARDNKGNQKSIDYFMGYLNTNHAKRLAALKSNREKYKARLQETAEIWTLQPGVLLENYPDLFEGNGGTTKRLTVYTIDPKVIELCKTDAPQWIVMHWTAHLNDPISLSLHNAHPQQRRLPVHLRLLLRSRQGEGAAVQAPPIAVVHRDGCRRQGIRGGREERGGSRRGVLRRFFLIARGQEAPQLAQHAGQHRRHQRRHGVEGTGRSLGVDGRHGDQADGPEDAPAA